MHPHFQFDAKAMKTWSAGPRAHQHEKGIWVGLTLVRVRIHAYHSVPTKWETDEVRLAAEQSNEMHHLGVKIYSFPPSEAA